jgi:hypothetical protein
MYPTKAPGPDGFPAHLFQRYWDLCGEEVTRAVLKILNGEDSPEVINKTFIVLIPKVAQPEEIGNSSLSLCNVIYKIASKVLANRLKVILPDIISEEQYVFVPGRLITDYRQYNHSVRALTLYEKGMGQRSTNIELLNWTCARPTTE